MYANKHKYTQVYECDRCSVSVKSLEAELKSVWLEGYSGAAAL